MRAASSLDAGIEASENPRVAPLGISTRERSGRANSAGLVEPQQDRPLLIPLTTDFRALSDGTLVELVSRQDSARGGLSFLIWNAETVSVADHFEHDGYFYTPPVLNEELSQDLNLRVPIGVKACPSPRELFLEIEEMIRSHVDLTEASICLVAAFVLSTWFVDNLAVVPLPVDLWSTGERENDTTTFAALSVPARRIDRREHSFAGVLTTGIVAADPVARRAAIQRHAAFSRT